MLQKNFGWIFLCSISAQWKSVITALTWRIVKSRGASVRDAAHPAGIKPE
jgi:hypothetical protein